MTIDLVDTDFNPLFMLLNTKAWGAARNELKSDPSLANGAIKLARFYGDKKVKTTVNALHIACKHNAPMDIIESLLTANSHALSEKDSSYQRLPLHVAALNGCSFRTIGAMLKENTKSARIQDIHGRLPLHYACKDRVNGERSLRHLLKVYPEGALVADDQGFLPLHVACRCAMPVNMIKMLLRVAPESILAKTNNGATPVHCAKNVKDKNETHTAMIELLIGVAEQTKNVVAVEVASFQSISGSATVSTGFSVSTLQNDHGLLRSIDVSKKVPTGIRICNVSPESTHASNEKDVPEAASISEESISSRNLTERSESEASLI